MRRVIFGVGLGFLTAGCGGPEGDAEMILALEADAIAGEIVYTGQCAVCHGREGQGGSGPTLQGSTLSDSTFVGIVLGGIGNMSGYRDVLVDQDVADLWAHVNAEIVPL